MLELNPGAWYGPRYRTARSLAFRGPHAVFGGLNPGLEPVTVERDYELFAFVAMNVWDLLCLNAIQGWQERCRRKVCYLVEFYAGQADEYRHLLQNLSAFDHVFLPFFGSAQAIQNVSGTPCHHLPLACDVQRFTPYPRPPRRVIDVLSIGGRSAPAHEALLKATATNDLFYVHDTIPGPLVQPSNAVQHRDQLASCAKRSRFFVAYEAKVGNSETQGQSEAGARYFEGAAAGAVLLGRAPTSGTFGQYFPWDEPVVPIDLDGSDLSLQLRRLLVDEPEIEKRGARNAIHALRHHDWGHRWDAMLQTAGLAPRSALSSRLRFMSTLADDAVAAGRTERISS